MSGSTISVTGSTTQTSDELIHPISKANPSIFQPIPAPVGFKVKPEKFILEAVRGFFRQNEFVADLNAFEPTNQSFGLLNPTSPDRWRKFRERISDLNKNAEPGVTYKVIYAGRHGEGEHNVGYIKYGTKAWENYWCHLETDGVLILGPDPPLTALGQAQARQMNAAWKREIRDGIPLPQRLYSSPFTRAAHTLELSFDGIFGDGLGEGRNLRPLVKEVFRETIGKRTSDKRGKRSVFEKRFPTFLIEDGLTEEDELWKPDQLEAEAEQMERMYRGLEGIFAEDVKDEYISISFHSGCMRKMFKAVGHHAYLPRTGEMVPMVIKATRVAAS